MAQDEVELTAALDTRHAEAMAAFKSRDVVAYGDLFSDKLRYEQADGKVIGKSQLMRNVKAQFRRLNRAESRFVRDDLVVEGAVVSEALIQHAICEASAFGFLRKTWSLERRGRYTWSLEDEHWRIIHVRVSHEHVEGSWKLSLS